MVTLPVMTSPELGLEATVGAETAERALVAAVAGDCRVMGTLSLAAEYQAR